jgi:hypothetical protein
MQGGGITPPLVPMLFCRNEIPNICTANYPGGIVMLKDQLNELTATIQDDNVIEVFSLSEIAEPSAVNYFSLERSWIQSKNK